jgi:hypothetical protein
MKMSNIQSGDRGRVTLDEGYEKEKVRDERNVGEGSAGGPSRKLFVAQRIQQQILTTRVAREGEGCKPIRSLHASPLFPFLVEKPTLQCCIDYEYYSVKYMTAQ